MFLKWWLQQLSELLPSGWARALAGRFDAAIIDIDGDSVSLLIRQAGETGRAERARADEAGFQKLAQALRRRDMLGLPLVLRVSSATALEKRVSFPLAVRSDLESLLGLEMDRETPFARGEVYWTHVVRRQDTVGSRLDVDLYIVPRAGIDPTLAAMRAAGLDPSTIELDPGESETGIGENGRDRIRIRIGAGKRWGWVRSERRLALIAAAAAAALILAITTPFIIQQIDLASADSAIDSLGEQAREAALLRQSVDQIGGAVSFMNKEHTRNGSVLAVLAATTELLPDDTHLTALSLRGGRLTITGVSPSAARLIDLLAQSPVFREPAFDSPVVQNDAGGLETFTISATFAQAGGS